MVEGDTVRCRKQKVRTCLWFGLGLLVASSEVIMRVVLIENPKFFAGLLRMLFGIKKEKQTIG